MILNSQERNVDNTFQSESNDFQIKASAKAFKILSDGLYSNKIRAVIRELSCNAFDGHVMANKTDEPFEVHLPNALEPHFSVKDFGIGMSHDEVMKLYSTYFESTKTNSNDVIGALGLGSKSPFSYTDSFTVISTKDGQTGTYMCYINEAMIPKVQVLNNEETDFPNGVEVSFSVKSQDFNEFKREAENVFRPFEIKPSILGIPDFDCEIYDVEDTIGEIQIIRGHRWGSKKWIATQGNIEYPLDVSKLTNIDYDLATDEEKANVKIIEAIYNHMNLVIPFQIGELDISASRESLGYDKQTIENIAKKVKTILVDIKDKIYEEINTAENDYDKLLKFNVSSNRFQPDMVIAALQDTDLKDKFNSNGTFEFATNGIEQMTMYSCKNRNAIDRKDYLKVSFGKTSFKPSGDIQIVLNDEKSPTVGITKARKLISEKGFTSVLLVSKGALDKIGNPNYEKISEYEFEKVETKKNTTLKGSNFKRYSGGFNHFTTFGPLSDSLQDADEILIFPILSNMPAQSVKLDCGISWDSAINFAQQSNLIGDVYGIRNDHYKTKRFQAAMEESNFKCVFEKINEVIAEMLKDEELVKELSEYKSSQQISNVTRLELEIYRNIKNGDVTFEDDSSIQIAYENYSKMGEFKSNRNLDSKLFLFETSGGTIETEEVTISFAKNEEFEMLFFIDTWDYRNDRNKILKYIGGTIVND